MSTRALAGLVIAVCGVLLMCSGLFSAVFVAGAAGVTSGCYPPADPSASVSAPVVDLTSPAGGFKPIGHWNAEQLGNAATIVTVGIRLGIPPRGWVIAVATAMQESKLINLPYLGDDHDHDSVGLFQQRPSQGWGSPDKLIDPAYAATKFFQALLRVDGWQSMPLTQAAQRVQKSAYPDAYAKWEPDATTVVGAVVSGDPRAILDDLEQCVSICPSVSGSMDGAAGACTDVTAVFARARSWLTAWSGGPVPYLSSNAPADLLNGYRRDCSGYVSMALGLPGPGLNTVDLAARSTVLTKIDLQPGDLMINPAFDLQGHVVLFERWADTSMSRYWGYEQSGDGGTHYHRIPFPYYGTYPMKPYRLRLGTISGE
jgi:hypothetical protein